ncbi:restriction endonuclease subunit S [Acidovorax sp. Leaf78]|uniref:restriction endonuclease subunit S n=1 Tax=Acidovorax sp. Leaf78 TaxID=1736237 RepID=UPI000700CC74|nr:restriction endonuclease subunit S [Acidovorax sp. Leaf78]KQO16993.1 hypothetical protein ASF16_14040 [Acidovorax sp. Leaf78]
MGYAQYKELDSSGISWLQKKPIHWRIKRLKFSTDLINNKVSVEDSPLPYLGLEHIESWTGRKIEGEISNSEGLASSFVMGDVLFGKLRPYLAKVHLAQQDGLISSEALVVRSKDELHAEFLKYYMLSRDFINIVDSSTFGSKMPRANWDFIGNLPVLLPDVEEQKVIARFLDFKTVQIDALIAKKKSLLDKLAEKRTALISHAVTKGLDPFVPMKDSGVAWLGDIPAHWKVIRIKHITPVKRGASPRPIDDPKYFDDDGEFAWVRISDVSASDRYLENTTQRLSELGSSLSVKRYPGDLFLSIAGTVGKPIITNIKCCIHDGFVYFPDLQESNEFFYYLFACGQPYLGLGKMGTQLNLNTDTVGCILIGLPTRLEQQAIVEFLDKKTAQLDAQVARINGAIDRLNEYRSALITNAVTGKIDVRDFEIPPTVEEVI